MKVMLSGVSMDPGSDGVTFCNIYTKDGIALNNTVLGDISVNDNLIYTPTNPDDTDSYFKVNNCSPYNLYHLNALYDLFFHTYLDAIVQKSRK